MHATAQFREGMFMDALQSNGHRSRCDLDERLATSIRTIHPRDLCSFYVVDVAYLSSSGQHSSRQCSRPGCSEPAAVTLTYEYAQSQVWLDRLANERDPHAYDLCGRHADRLTAPKGWLLRDRRPAAEPARPRYAPVYGAIAV